jgi:tetratricopeptide (TPR) repeat protein
MKLILMAILGAAALSAQTPAALAASAERARLANDPAAISLYQRALKANPKWQEGWWQLGNLEYGKDHYAECTEAFRQLSELIPKGPAFAMQGLCEAGAKDYQPALEHLKRGLELGVNNDAIEKSARYNLTRLYTRAGDFEQALRVVAELGEAMEESPPFITLAGTAALWMPVFAEDIPASDRELVYLAGKAFWHAFARNAATAQKDLEELAARYPDRRGVHYLYGSFELRNDPDKAIAQFDLELKIDPGHIGALSAISAEYQRRNEPAKGIPYARSFVEKAPDSVASHTLLGRLLADNGDTAEGTRELEKAREIDPSDPQPHITLASLYAKAGRAEDAARERAAFIKAKDGK